MTGPADADAVAHVFVGALDDRCVIGGDDGHHLRRARRLSVGERVTAADGTGEWRAYEIVELVPAGVVLGAVGERRAVAAPAVALALAVALTKGGLDGIVASVTELGVARITPMRTEHTVVRWDAARAERAVARLRVVAREAAMQCRRARVPAVDEVADVSAVAARPDVIVADRAGRRAFELAPPGRGEWTVAVGPEGGFSPADLELFAGRERLAVGDHVLRAATAPVAVAAVLAERMAQNRP